MSDQMDLVESDSHTYRDHEAQLQRIVQGVARLRRWSRFSVVWTVTACLCVFIAIQFAASAVPDTVSHYREYSANRELHEPHAVARSAQSRVPDQVEPEKAMGNRNAPEIGLESDACAADARLLSLRKEVAKLQLENARAEEEIAKLRVAVLKSNHRAAPAASPKNTNATNPF